MVFHIHKTRSYFRCVFLGPCVCLSVGCIWKKVSPDWRWLGKSLCTAVRGQTKKPPYIHHHMRFGDKKNGRFVVGNPKGSFRNRSSEGEPISWCCFHHSGYGPQMFDWVRLPAMTWYKWVHHFYFGPFGGYSNIVLWGKTLWGTNTSHPWEKEHHLLKWTF